MMSRSLYGFLLIVLSSASSSCVAYISRSGVVASADASCVAVLSFSDADGSHAWTRSVFDPPVRFKGPRERELAALRTTTIAPAIRERTSAPEGRVIAAESLTRRQIRPTSDKTFQPTVETPAIRMEKRLLKNQLAPGEITKYCITVGNESESQAYVLWSISDRVQEGLVVDRIQSTIQWDNVRIRGREVEAWMNHRLNPGTEISIEIEIRSVVAR